MSNLDEIRTRYTVDQVKATFYSMLDSMWDLAYNYNMCHQSGYTISASRTIIRDATPSWVDKRGIEEQMRRDTDLIFDGHDFSDVKKFIRAFIDEFYDCVIACMKRYVGGDLIKGRLYPEEVATNGVKKAYLFVHERHPKHVLNKTSMDYANTIADGIFREKLKDDKGYLVE